MAEMKIEMESTLTCPRCGFADKVPMPGDACQFFHACRECGVLLKPKPGDCCVFCTYGDIPCPPKQMEKTKEGE
jgi:hypothetical protein